VHVVGLGAHTIRVDLHVNVLARRPECRHFAGTGTSQSSAHLFSYSFLRTLISILISFHLPSKSLKQR
jgi:hypothetical protein